MQPLITIDEVKTAIAEQEKARDQALAQANFHNGYIAALNEIRARLEGSGEDFPEVLETGSEVKALTTDASGGKNGRKRG